VLGWPRGGADPSLEAMNPPPPNRGGADDMVLEEGEEPRGG
jgi:hypothetical protein